VKKARLASSWWTVAALVALLLLLAMLQYHWLDRVSESDRERLRARMAEAAERLATDFDRELTRTFLFLAPMGAPHGVEELVERYERYATSAPYPSLLRELYLVTHAHSGSLEMQRLVLDEGRFEPVSPDDLPESVRDALRPPPGAPPRARLAAPLVPELPGMLVPLSAGPFALHAEGKLAGALIALLDRETITDVLLPDLAERHFGTAGGIDRHLRVVGPSWQSGPVFETGPGSDRVEGNGGDVEVALFSLLPLRDLHTLGLPADLGGHRHGRRLRRAEGRVPRGGREALAALLGAEPRWRLQVTHPAGSVDAAVAHARLHNLGIALFVLLLLALSVLLLVRSARRAQRLARQQMEFVAGVTHELSTPLAAMRSAAQNLADGIVAGDEQVRRYGSLIDRQARRLGDMVDQVLAFSGMLAGRETTASDPVDLGDAVRGALDDCRPMLEEAGLAVETDVPGDLPPVTGDLQALRVAVRNLVENAATYAASGGWAGIRVEREAGSRGEELRLTVADRGPGVDPDDRGRLFEPFYRGRNGKSGTIRGSGLGLTLVRDIAESHGGHVQVTSPEGGGTAITLVLPVARAPGSER
jgi:signal transduction histidine kinase